MAAPQGMEEDVFDGLDEAEAAGPEQGAATAWPTDDIEAALAQVGAQLLPGPQYSCSIFRVPWCVWCSRRAKQSTLPAS